MDTNRRLLREIRTSGLLFPLTVFFGILSGGLILLQARLLTRAINAAFLDHEILRNITPILGGFLLIVMLRAVFILINEYLAGKLAVSVKKHIRNLLFEKIERLGPSFTSHESTGELTASAFQGVEALDAYFSQYLPQILLSAILPVMILFTVFPLDMLTGFVFLFTAPLIPFFMILVGKASEAETRKQWSALSRLSSYLLDTLQGLVTLKNLGKSKIRTAQIHSISDDYRLTTLRVLRITFLSALVLELLATLSTAVVAVEIGLRLLYNKVGFEQAFYILLLAPEFYLPMRNLGTRFHAGMTGVAAAKRIYELLDLPEVKKTSGIIPAIIPSDNFYIHFEKVSFRYPDREKDALSNITFGIECGKSYGLVGRSGSGKTTLQSLLLRFMDSDSGQILVNGQNLSALDLTEWRKRISWVPQSPSLFNTTVLENIRLAKPGSSLEEVREAAKEARLDDFVLSLPAGYETIIGEKAARLSGGQAQRIALARAFLKDAPLLLMDEPTSHLDIELEKDLTESIKLLLKDRTALIIAHRFSTIQILDRVFLMDEGKLTGEGTPEELQNNNVAYLRLMEAARGGL